jgi:hypothetical protein
LRNIQRALDGRQRRYNHLNIKNRHEHADTHHGEADPDGSRD